MKLVQGKTYRGELVLPWYASEAAAKNKLLSVGFGQVVTYHVGDKLYVQGRWMQATQEVDVPSAVRNPTEVS